MKEDREYVCDQCNGTGVVSVIIEMHELQFQGQKISTPGISRKELCPKCKGDVRLNWVENIFGKEESNFSKEFKELQKIQPISPSSGLIFKK